MSLDPVPGRLLATLREFRRKVNDHARVRTLIRGWEPVIVIETVDANTTHFLPVSDCQITDVTDVDPRRAHTVHLRAAEDELVAIFNGDSNPAEAFLNGQLELFAADKDQVKLDAISLVLWGM